MTCLAVECHVVPLSTDTLSSILATVYIVFDVHVWFEVNYILYSNCRLLTIQGSRA